MSRVANVSFITHDYYDAPAAFEPRTWRIVHAAAACTLEARVDAADGGTEQGRDN